MSNLNDSFMKIADIMRNAFLSFDITAEARESLTRVNDQLRNIVKVYDSTLLMENQREFIEMSSQIANQLRDSKVIIKDFGDLSEISNNLVKFAKEMDVSYRNFCKIWQQYDYTKLTKIMQDTLKAYDYNNPFDVNVITEQITEAYIAGEEPESTEKSENIEAKDRREHINNIRDWIGFCIGIISFCISVYSLVSTKPSSTYYTTIEVNNYYVNDLEISAEFFKNAFYSVSYTDYFFSLPMGAGKTYLMAAFIYLDLYFARNEPLNTAFAHYPEISIILDGVGIVLVSDYVDAVDRIFSMLKTAIKDNDYFSGRCSGYKVCG